MKRLSFLLLAAMLMPALAIADDYLTEPLKLQTPEMKFDLKSEPEKAPELNVTALNKGMDFDFFKTKTNPGVKPYKFLDDMTFVGVPLFIAGWAIKGDKAMFRVNDKNNKSNVQLLTDFKTGIDDYTQFFGPVMTVGLKLGGLEGRSDWPRLLASAGLSYAIMAGFVNGIKYTAKEMRPDGSTANSWPSGHTATSFVGATLLHKEYGLTRSPWFSVAGYGVATATGVMRVLNNRHWVSDVMSGAGIGILSTELGYALGDLLFKGKGLLRNDMVIDSENPSFFGISMGVGLGGKNIGFHSSDLQEKWKFSPDLWNFDDEVDEIEFRPATVVDAEGAYFFNKYVGVGGRLRVRAMSAKSFGFYTDVAGYMGVAAWSLMSDMYGMTPMTSEEEFYNSIGMDIYAGEFTNPSIAPVTEIGGVVKSDHMAEFTGSVGLYFNLPLGKHFSLGTKALIGRSITQELDIDAYAKGNKKDIYSMMTIENGGLALDDNGDPLLFIGYPTNTGETYSTEWDYVTLGANNSTSWGTGLSLTYRYKSNFSWRLFCDYDTTEKTYSLKFTPYYFLLDGLSPTAYSLTSLLSYANNGMETREYKKKKKMNYFTLGLSFMVNL